MYFLIYKITNNINGKLYIGAHQTTNIDDGYMGSGTYLKRAFTKYGIENFSKEILHIFKDKTEMFLKEAELVNNAFIEDKNTYNLIPGGANALNYFYDNNIELRLIKNKKARRKCNETLMKKYGVIHAGQLDKTKKSASERLTRLHKEGKFDSTRKSFLGKKHTEESKKKIGLKNSITQKGERNSSFGKIWIFNPTTKQTRKLIKTTNIPDGWIQGRK